MLLIATLGQCPNYCEECGKVDVRFFENGKIASFNDERRKEEGVWDLIKKLKSSCPKGLIKEMWPGETARKPY